MPTGDNGGDSRYRAPSPISELRVVRTTAAVGRRFCVRANPSKFNTHIFMEHGSRLVSYSLPYTTCRTAVHLKSLQSPPARRRAGGSHWPGRFAVVCEVHPERRSQRGPTPTGKTRLPFSLSLSLSLSRSVSDGGKARTVYSSDFRSHRGRSSLHFSAQEPICSNCGRYLQGAAVSRLLLFYYSGVLF